MSIQRSPSRDRLPSERLSKDTIFSMLSNQRRRHVLYYLDRESGPVSLRDLAEQIAAWENDVAVSELDYKQRKRVYTSLHQTHLPKLDDAGIVSYDRENGTVTLADRADDLDAYFERVGQYDVPWWALYLGLSVVATLVLLAGLLDVFPPSLLPDLAIAGAVVALFGLLAGVHWYLVRRNHIGGDDAPIENPDD